MVLHQVTYKVKKAEIIKTPILFQTCTKHFKNPNEFKTALCKILTTILYFNCLSKNAYSSLKR